MSPVVGVEGYRLFRKGRQGRKEGVSTFYVNHQLECMELHLGMDEEKIWVRIKRKGRTGNIIVGPATDHRTRNTK